MNFKAIFNFLLDVFKLSVMALLILLPIRAYIAEPFVVLGASMEPNFENRDYLIVDQLTYKFREPKRGEVIVFKYPYDQNQFYIKRIIGLPGEIIDFKDGKVFIKNKENPEGFFLNEKYIDSTNQTFGRGPITLKYDEYFVMGDNRGASSDSRRWGPLKKEYIIGRVLLRLMPFERVKLYTNSYNY